MPPADGQPIRGEREKKALYDVVKAHLMGTSAAQQQLLLAASGGGAFGPAAGPFAAAGGERLATCSPSMGTSVGDPQQQSLLRALSGRWKFG